MPKLYYEKDADHSLIAGRKVAVIGYGSQGHAHAQNLRDSGVDVRVGLREGSASREKAQAEGLSVLSVAEACKEADLIMMLVADTDAPAVYEEHVAPNMKSGDALFFAHGFNIRYRDDQPTSGHRRGHGRPQGSGHLLRRTYTEGGGIPSLIAVAQDASGKAMDLALAYADAIGATRAGVLETTFTEETETDLFGEQVVLCGGSPPLSSRGLRPWSVRATSLSRPTSSACTS